MKSRNKLVQLVSKCRRKTITSERYTTLLKESAIDLLSVMPPDWITLRNTTWKNPNELYHQINGLLTDELYEPQEKGALILYFANIKEMNDAGFKSRNDADKKILALNKIWKGYLRMSTERVEKAIPHWHFRLELDD